MIFTLAFDFAHIFGIHRFSSFVWHPILPFFFFASCRPLGRLIWDHYTYAGFCIWPWPLTSKIDLWSKILCALESSRKDLLFDTAFVSVAPLFTELDGGGGRKTPPGCGGWDYPTGPAGLSTTKRCCILISLRKNRKLIPLQRDIPPSILIYKWHSSIVVWVKIKYI